MTDFSNAFCPNTDCKDYGLQNRGNIAIRGKYGKAKDKISFIAGHVVNALHQRELQHFSDFIYPMIKSLKLFTMPPKGLGFEQHQDYWISIKIPLTE